MHLPTVRRRNPKSVVSDVQADNVILNGQPYNLIRYWNRRCTVQTRESSVISTEAPEDLHKLFATALNSGDLDALVALYASDGFLMARSGPARGISEIRKALAEYVAMKPTIQLTTRRVVQVGAPPCLWQIGDFTEPPAMAEMYQPLAPVSKSLVANRTGVGVTSSTFPTGSVNPLAEN